VDEARKKLEARSYIQRLKTFLIMYLYEGRSTTPSFSQKLLSRLDGLTTDDTNQVA